jgi:hypothetical protein
MGNFVAWLLAIPTAALVLAYVVICACLINAKKRMSDGAIRRRQHGSIAGFRGTGHSLGQAQVMARRVGG